MKYVVIDCSILLQALDMSYHLCLHVNMLLVRYRYYLWLQCCLFPSYIYNVSLDGNHGPVYVLCNSELVSFAHL
jgi:hypothetical protein